MNTTRLARTLAAPVLLLALAASSLHADFSYEETSKLTGGALASMMKVVGVFARSAREPIRTTILVKGNQMARITADSATVIDLDREIITEINFNQKTYSVVTFAQMVEAMAALSKKAAQQSGTTEVNFKAAVQETGQTREISGLPAREVILTLTMEGTDRRSGSTGTIKVTSDMWLARDVPGYQEVKAFNQRLAEKLAWTPGGGAFFQGRSDMAKAFANLQREAAKLEGLPLLQTITMSGSGEGQSGQAEAPAPQQESARPSIGGALGRLGGLGGLGRRKKEETPKQETPPSAAAAQANLLEITTEMSGFSISPVDAAKFVAPAGFRQVESELLKSMK